MKSLILWNANLILRKKILILLNASLITWNENLITFETKSALEYKSTLNFICISILKRPFHEFNKLGKICRQHGKERLKISKIVSSAKSRNFTDVCIVGRNFTTLWHTYIFDSFQQITIKLGNFTNFLLKEPWKGLLTVTLESQLDEKLPETTNAK